MKFSAKLKLERANAGHLIRAFFQEFNPKNILQIKGDEAKAEIFFEENPPMKIVEAISHCFVLSFCYVESDDICEQDDMNTMETEPVGEAEPDGEVEPDSEVEPDGETESNGGVEPDSEAESDGEVKPDSEAESDGEVKPVGKAESNGEVESDGGVEPYSEAESDGEVKPVGKAEPNGEAESDGEVEPNNNTVTKTVCTAYTEEIPELTSIASNVANYDEFLTGVLDWLEIGKDEKNPTLCEQRRLAFLSIEQAVTNGCSRWKEIASQAVYNTRDKNYLWTAFANKMRECGHDMKLLKFLKILVLYRNYQFTTTVQDNAEKDTSTKEIVTFYPLNDVEKAELAGKIDEASEDASTNAEVTDEPKTIMSCLAEVTWFITFINSIDKTKTIEEKVEEVLVKMNLEEPKYADVKKKILDIAIKAMKARSIEDMIELKTFSKSRMDFSSFLNDFADKNSSKKVKVIDFLKELREVILV